MSLQAILIDQDERPIDYPREWVIDSDDDFDDVVVAAQEIAANGTKCAIQWTRDSDGQVAYWGPSGATFKPHWFARMGRPELPPEDRTKPRTIWMTDAEWAKVQAAPKGWVRGLVQRAKAPA